MKRPSTWWPPPISMTLSTSPSPSPILHVRNQLEQTLVLHWTRLPLPVHDRVHPTHSHRAVRQRAPRHGMRHPAAFAVSPPLAGSPVLLCTETFRGARCRCDYVTRRPPPWFVALYQYYVYSYIFPPFSRWDLGLLPPSQKKNWRFRIQNLSQKEWCFT
jgi:hypothetical protein